MSKQLLVLGYRELRAPFFLDFTTVFYPKMLGSLIGGSSSRVISSFLYL
jgi:hypothetical protein